MPWLRNNHCVAIRGSEAGHLDTTEDMILTKEPSRAPAKSCSELLLSSLLDSFSFSPLFNLPPGSRIQTLLPLPQESLSASWAPPVSLSLTSPAFHFPFSPTSRWLPAHSSLSLRSLSNSLPLNSPILYLSLQSYFLCLSGMFFCPPHRNYKVFFLAMPGSPCTGHWSVLLLSFGAYSFNTDHVTQPLLLTMPTTGHPCKCQNIISLTCLGTVILFLLSSKSLIWAADRMFCLYSL